MLGEGGNPSVAGERDGERVIGIGRVYTRACKDFGVT